MRITENQKYVGTLPGATDHGEGLITFAIYAPGKKEVHIAGSFNDWQWTEDILEEVEPGYWVTAKKLSNGQHSYQFIIERELTICDPYAQQIKYRTEEDNVPVAVIDVGRPIYKWQNDNWQHPSLNDLILYEIHVGDFSTEGTFKGITKRLEYLKELGVNAIEFMPLYECAKGDYWGYQPLYYFAPRCDFGNFWDLVTMIDEAHKYGIVVIIDLVIAHTGHEHPFNKMYPYEQSPWYGRGLGEQNQFGLPTFDYSKDPPNGFIRDIEAYWLKVFHIDGFRYDYLAGIGSKDGKGLPNMMKLVSEILPQAILIGECLPENPELVNNSGLNAVWHTRSRLALTSLLVQNDIEPYSWSKFKDAVEAFDPKTQDYDKAAFMINYVESHDDKRLMFMLKESGFDTETCVAKSKLAASILMTLPGEPMLFAGQEIGQAKGPSQKENKIDWINLDDENLRNLHEYFKKMCRLRRSRQSLRSENFKYAMIDENRRCIVYYRKSGFADQAVIAINFSDTIQDISVEFPFSGNWHEYLTGQIFQIDKEKNWQLEPYTSVIFLSGVS